MEEASVKGTERRPGSTRIGGPALFSGKRLWCNFLRLFARQHLPQVGARCQPEVSRACFKLFFAIDSRVVAGGSYGSGLRAVPASPAASPLIQPVGHAASPNLQPPDNASRATRHAARSHAAQPTLLKTIGCFDGNKAVLPTTAAIPPTCAQSTPAWMKSPADRKSTRLNSSHAIPSRMPSSA